MQTDGDADAAIALLKPKEFELGEDIEKAIDKLKAVVKAGNVDRIQVKKGDEVVLSVPVNAGIVGGIVGFAAIPWALIAASAAAFGLGCRLEVVKKDGSTDEVK